MAELAALPSARSRRQEHNAALPRVSAMWRTRATGLPLPAQTTRNPMERTVPLTATLAPKTNVMAQTMLANIPQNPMRPPAFPPSAGHATTVSAQWLAAPPMPTAMMAIYARLIVAFPARAKTYLYLAARPPTAATETVKKESPPLHAPVTAAPLPSAATTPAKGMRSAMTGIRRAATDARLRV